MNGALAMMRRSEYTKKCPVDCCIGAPRVGGEGRLRVFASSHLRESQESRMDTPDLIEAGRFMMQVAMGS